MDYDVIGAYGELDGAEELYLPLIKFMSERDKILTERNLYVALESYNIMTNNDICDIFTELRSYLDLDAISDLYIGKDPLPQSLRSDIESYGFTFVNKTEQSVTLVKDFTEENSDYDAVVNIIMREPKFRDYEILFQNVTPFNYELITKGRHILMDSLDPLTVFYRLVLETYRLKGSDFHMITIVDRENKSNSEILSKARVGNDLIQLGALQVSKNMNDRIAHALAKEMALSENDLDLPNGYKGTLYNFLGTGISLRVNIIKSLGGYSITVRLISNKTVAMEIDELGFDDGTTKLLHSLAKKETGFLFVTGAIRTGKNTTLFAVLNALARRNPKIFDFSSPAEVLMEFDQFDYNDDEKKLLAYVKAAKKSDVDIIHINELPSKEVAQISFDIVNSSVGLLTTMHIDRLWFFPFKLQEYFGENYINVIPQINAIITQKSFVRQCPHCRKPKAITELVGEDEWIKTLLHKNLISSYYESVGCEKCNHSGIIPGIQPVAEYLEFTDDVKLSLMSCKNLAEMSSYIQDYVLSRKQDMLSKLLVLIQAGDIHPKYLEKIK